jgi:hypothetical protein
MKRKVSWRRPRSDLGCRAKIKRKKVTTAFNQEEHHEVYEEMEV